MNEQKNQVYHSILLYSHVLHSCVQFTVEQKNPRGYSIHAHLEFSQGLECWPMFGPISSSDSCNYQTSLSGLSWVASERGGDLKPAFRAYVLLYKKEATLIRLRFPVLL